MSFQFNRPGGRPTKLTAEIQAKIIDAIRAGNYIETAAAFAGISKDTLYTWLRKGRHVNRGKYRDFALAVEKALADGETRDVTIIGKAAEKDWRAAAWRLERKFPDRWGRHDHHQIDAQVRGNIDMNAGDVGIGLTVKQVAEELEATKRALELAQGAIDKESGDGEDD